jgi:hypothetical protein
VFFVVVWFLVSGRLFLRYTGEILFGWSPFISLTSFSGNDGAKFSEKAKTVFLNRRFQFLAENSTPIFRAILVIGSDARLASSIPPHALLNRFTG